MNTKEDFQDGQVLLIDKPVGWTSFQAVNSVRWAIRRRFGLKKIKVGHAGTLDPLASGLLVICTGRATRKIGTFQGMPKEYRGTFTLGATTPSYDLETRIDREFPFEHIRESDLRDAAMGFTGRYLQKPPVFSAIKKDGRRLYEYARDGVKVNIPLREVAIMEFELTAIELPKVEFRVVCGKGTYIRSLADDFGKSLGSGAYLSALRRTKIGDYNVNKALEPSKFQESLHNEGQ